MRRAVPVLLLAISLACGGPVGPVSGGVLSGEAAEAPANWSFVDGVDQVQLETNPAEPYSVNTWVGSAEGKLYVPTSMILGPNTPSEREWVRNAQADANVRIRISAKIYERRAVRVSDVAEYAAARAALEKKYALGPDDMDPEREIWIFRLDAR